ncbi:hypothetical protein HFP15_00710 [Amycolatopsis sp. K13G38]|uniref:Integral membrane protein n=1 Tax=Amycolatopsis acididurans TaxID=2724524 RepID=A0ABX1IW26_9PSEU|nr:hypothetical protein [Amycolatopsis acididurans]NKQ51401.1 hypothetical protein [Amycolatopsis acididurans]
MNKNLTAAPPLRTVRLLAVGYLALSVLTLVAAALLHGDPALVTDAVWIRGLFVLLNAALIFLFTVRAANGSRPALRRLRIISAVMLAAAVVIIALPGTFPVWLRIEQAVCGVLLAAVVVLVNRRRD